MKNKKTKHKNQKDMMKMRKLFLKLSMLLLVLTMSVNAAWALAGDWETWRNQYNGENSSPSWFYVKLNAKISTSSCTATTPGTMKLSFVDQNGVIESPTWIYGTLPDIPSAYEDNNAWAWINGFNSGVSDFKEGTFKEDWETHDWGWTQGPGSPEYAATSLGYKVGYDWASDGNCYYLNTVNPTAFGTTASVRGYSTMYAPGIDMGPLGGLASTYVHFNAIVTENPGWYFVGWSYMDGGTDIAGTVTTDTENEQDNIFEILPSSKNGIANIRQQDVYATFQPVLVADYKVAGMIPGTNEITTVTFDYVGERVDATDFDITIADEEGNPSKFEQVGDADYSVAGKVTITVKHTGSVVGEHRGSVTLASKSGCSSLTAPVFARVPSDATIEATLYDGQTPTVTTGDLTDMINAAHNTDYIVTLNKNYGIALTVDKVVKMDLNGYQVTSALTIANGGVLTLNYSKYGGKLINNITVQNGGKLILNGAEITGTVTVNAGGELVQNGATITSAVTNNGTFTATEGKLTNGLTSAGTLTINGGVFEGTTAIAVTAGTATINKGTISGTTYGIQTSGNSNTTITSKLVSIYGGTNAVKCDAGTLTLQNGRFDGATAPLSGTIALESGFFKTTTIGIDMPEGKKRLNVLAGNEFNEGYRYFIGTDESAKNSGVGICRIGTTPYATLEDALAFANNNSNKEVVIFMLNDYVLPAGYYTLPAKAKLIVPMSDEQETDNPIITRLSNNRANPVDYVQPTEFRRLTFATGVNIEVFGLIELTCVQRASDDAYAAMPHGNYGHLVMEEGSHMVLQNGAELRAWGYMTGKGETDARRGSIVREQFQMGDWKGGQNSFNMINPDYMGGANLTYFHIFPISQYFIQNIESPVKYHPGAVLSTTTSVSATFGDNGQVGITAAANDIPVVGVSGQHTAMFLMDIAADAENTWVRKWYDAENDVQTYEVNSGAHIGSMVLDLGSLGSWNIVMNSGQFVLPIMNNMKIHLLSGEMDFTQSTSLLPGAEVEIDKESTVSITNSSNPAIVSGSLYVYDAAQWINPVWGKFGDQPAIGQGLSWKNTVVVKYSPSWDRSLVGGDKPIDGKPTVRDEHGTLESASINVHGTFDAKQGFVFTTESGANIHSTNEDAGTFIYTKEAPENENVFYINPIEGADQEYGGLIYGQVATSAQLKNGDNSYTQTTGAGEHQSFIYMDNEWKTSESEYIQLLYFDCFTAEANMMTYALHVTNEDYVKQIAMAEAPVRIREYLIADAFAKANGFEGGIAPREYEYFRSTYYSLVAAQGKDAGEAAMTSAMQNSGDPNQIAASSLVPIIPVFKEQAESYSGTYDLGDAVQKIYIKPQEWLEIVGQAHIQLGLDAETIEGFETTYTTTSGLALDQVVKDYLDYITDNLQNPYLVGVDGNTDHTYSDAAGAGRLFILMTNQFGECDQWWEVEKKDNLYHCIHPLNDTYYYWDDEWVEQMFSVTWKNWNDTILKTANDAGALVSEYYVKYGTMPEYLGSNPTRSSNIDYTYDFTGWSPALGPVTQNVTYTATYTEKPRMYTIIFQNEGGTEIERHFLTHNEVPVCENTPTKVGHTLEWVPAVAAVTGDATYRATWLENPPTEYEVTFYDYDGTTELKKGNVDVGVMPTEPVFANGKWNDDDDLTGKPATDEFTYVFDHWSPALEEVSATSIKSYTAVYAEVAKTYTVIFQDKNGDEIERHQYQYGETPVCSETLSQAADAQYTYTLRWAPQIQTVMADATYRAVFDETLNKYTVSVKSNPSGACAISGAGIYDYCTDDDAVTITITPNPGYTFNGWSDAAAIGEPDEGVYTRQMAITSDINLVANFTYEGEGTKHTISWKKEDGSANLIDPVTQLENTATIYTGAIPTKPATAQSTFTFDGWTTSPNGAGTYYKNNMTPKATANATYYAHFAATEVIMEIGLGQAQNIAEATTVNQLILNSNGTVSGQLTGANILNVTGACYYDLTGTFNAGKWYAVAVPWQVTAGMITANGYPLSWTSGNYLAYYDGLVRAAQGKVDACWKYVSNSDVLVPGRLYMLYLENSASVLRFPKKADAPILSTTTGVSEYAATDAADANWNGIANPAIFYAYLSNTGATVGQVFNADAQSYQAVALSNKLIVAKPIFVQATNTGSAVAVTTPPASAPARRSAAAESLNAEYQVEIASYGRMQDRLFINANEDKEADTYTLGQDVLKFGVSDKVAQMWVDRYDTKLCMNTMTPVSSVAEFPLSIFAPRTGEYTISIENEKASEDHALYLTYNGEAIWNLSEGEYTANLSKGTEANYGLRISIKNAPQVETGVDEAIVNAQGETRKVLINNQVFIIRGDKVYSIDGQLVK